MTKDNGIEERDEKGRIVKKVLTTEKSRKMNLRRHAKRKGEKASDYEMLLLEAGYPDPEKAPKVLQVVAKQVAEEGTRSIPAIVQYRQLTSIADKPVAQVEGCPHLEHCSIYAARDRDFTREEVDAAQTSLEEYRTKQHLEEEVARLTKHIAQLQGEQPKPVDAEQDEQTPWSMRGNGE